VRDGTVLPEQGYTRGATLAGRSLTGLVDGRTAVAEFRNGATVVFQGLHRSFPPLVDLIAELELELGHPCQANAYLTPPGSQGFAVHSDTHDVFVLQTAGTKQWELHAPPGHPDQDVEEPVLEPGHVMYLPTGTPHAARAQDTVSLHVTIGINQLTWRGLVERSLSSLAAEVPSDHLPAGYLADPQALAHQLGRHLSDIADRLHSVDPTDVIDAEVRRFLTSRPPRLEGALVDRSDDGGDRLEVLLGDRTLDVPARIRPALEEVRDRRELRPRDLPLDEPSRLVLARRLVREGLLRVVNP
jgi:lysine-specific demethylase/histidyl-hydroxylase NO66